MSEKPVVKLEQTGVVRSDGRVDMASLSKSGVSDDEKASVLRGCGNGGDEV